MATEIKIDTAFWREKKVVVAGGAGFIGSHIVDNLKQKRGVREENIFVPRSKNYDLRKLDDCQRALKNADIVFHLAGMVGGIGFTKSNAAGRFYNTALLDLQVVEAARLEGVGKIVVVGNSTAYPPDAKFPLVEDDLLKGIPDKNTRAYGFAKRMQIIQAETYHEQYGMNIALVIGGNAYGPRDNFDKQSSHVLPALIRRCFEEPELVVWGDGTPTRDFIYVEDFAESVILAAEKLNTPDPVNIASGIEVSIKEIVTSVVKSTGFKGKVSYDTSKPAGQPRRVLSIERARKRLGFEPRYHIQEGIEKTVAWYKANYLNRSK